ncbi:MAG: hypothetical protein COA33_010450 [Fluviicola sp.]|nr:hypothetical protein [Fluviicola sp.]
MIDYKDFFSDCSYIIESYLKGYGFKLYKQDEDEFISYYSNNSYCIMISMLENFPHIGVSWGGLDLNFNLISPSLIANSLKIDPKKEMLFYEEFQSSNNLINYASEMHYIVAVMEKFYKPILTGEINLYDIKGL